MPRISAEANAGSPDLFLTCSWVGGACSEGSQSAVSESNNEATAELLTVDMETCWDICFTRNCQGLVKDQM